VLGGRRNGKRDVRTKNQEMKGEFGVKKE